ncbi:MAG: DUF3667 domain-containing protein [Alphaproteobacteria bacterium]|nr:DUF3667 domain-containing protein [Alphaproteobacteria bacterium]
MSDPVMDAATADALASEASKAKRGHPASRFDHTIEGECSNCGTPLKGQICHSCGQDSDILQRPFWNHVLEILDGQLGVDGKLWRTLPALMFRPGYVTRQYLSGVRARYVQPFRLYIFASFVFLFLLWGGSGGIGDLFQNEAVDVDPETIAELEAEIAAMEVESPERAAQLRRVLNGLQGSEAESDSSGDLSITDALSTPGMREDMKAGVRRVLLPEEATEPAQPGDAEIVVGEPGANRMTLDVSGLAWLPYMARERLVHQIEIIIDDPSRWFEAMRASVSWLLILLLPVYALVIAIGQVWRRGFYYYDHLIVSLHFHSFLFILMAGLMLLSPLIGGWGVLIFLVWSNLYLYRLHRVVYEHGRFMSAIRTVTLDFTYMIILMFAFVLLMLVGLLAA